LNRMLAQPQRAPRLGEHTVQVLEEVVGLDAAQIRRLRNAKIIAGPEVNAC
jgi:crotonobetainyl-CoA:carnitine CoA-transferase CaiB-like acyl-CoA transferase